MKSTRVDRVRSMADRAPTGRRQRPRNRRRSFAGRVVEVLEGRVLLHANVVEDAEHIAVFGSHNTTTGVITGGLVPDSAVTIESVPNAANPSAPLFWTSPSTWTLVSNGVPIGNPNNVIPQNFADVLITRGTTVTINSDLS